MIELKSYSAVLDKEILIVSINGIVARLIVDSSIAPHFYRLDGSWSDLAAETNMDMESLADRLDLFVESVL